MKILIIIGILLTFGTLLEAIVFGYSQRDQDEWSLDYPECSGNRQSPINIQTNTVESVKFPSLKLMGFNKILANTFQASNDGHSVKFTINNNGNNSFTPSVTGANLNGTYIFNNFHFHWGKGSEGSEHAINGRKRALEFHMVFTNNKYEPSEVNNHDDGLAVLGILYYLSRSDGLELKPLIENIQYIHMVNATHNVRRKFSLRFVLGAINLGKFYTYQGSLTTPPCSQSVTWIIFQDELRVSDSQLDQFRNILDAYGYKLVSNDRFLQPLNNRTIEYRPGGLLNIF